MNRVIRMLNGAWSVVCILAIGGLLWQGVYWALLQRPYLSVNTEGMALQYDAPAGSILYIENPIFPPDTLAQVDLQADLVGEGTSYKLASPSESDVEVEELPLPALTKARPGYPVYPLFIPSYVKAGVYRYEVTASYRLNPFKTEQLVLPPVTITVY